MLNNIKYSTNSRIKRIEFQTCGQIYDELKEINPKLYRNSPSNGVKVNVEYVDTFGDNDIKSSSDVKTIVAIHGIPGYHYHFKELIDYFGGKESKVRVIVPNMPDFGLTRQTMAFWHSNQERSQFIRDFLRAINVSKVDCLVSHSAGIHPISMIWTEPEELSIGSIALFSPQCLWFPQYFLRLSQFFSYLTRNKFGIKIMDTIKPHLIAHKAGYPMSYANVDEVLLTVHFGSNGLNQNLLHQRLEYLKTKKIPTLVVYGERDKLLLKSNLIQMTQHLSADQKDFAIYSNENTIEKDFERENWIKVLVFRNGGHFAFGKYGDIVNRYLIKHLLT